CSEAPGSNLPPSDFFPYSGHSHGVRSERGDMAPPPPDARKKHSTKGGSDVNTHRALDPGSRRVEVETPAEPPVIGVLTSVGETLDAFFVEIADRWRELGAVVKPAAGTLA